MRFAVLVMIGGLLGFAILGLVIGFIIGYMVSGCA